MARYAEPFPLKFASYAQAREVGERAEEQRYRRKLRSLQETAGSEFAAGDTKAAIGTLAKGGDVQGAARLQAVDAQRQKLAMDQAMVQGKQLAGMMMGILNAPEDQRPLLWQAARAQAGLDMGIDVSNAPAQYGPEAEAFMRTQIGRFADVEKAMDRKARMERTRLEAEAAQGRSETAAESRVEAARIRAGATANKAKAKTLMVPGMEGPQTGYEKNGRLFVLTGPDTYEPAPPGTAIMGVTSTPGQVKADKVADRHWNAARDSARAYTDLANDIVEELRRGDVRLGAAGALVNSINSLEAQAKQLVQTFGNAEDERGLQEYLNTNDFDGIFEENAIANQRVKSALTLMAYMQAKISDESGRVSDKDLEAHLEALAGKSSNPKVLMDTIVQNTNRMHRRIKERARDEGREVPEFEWNYSGGVPNREPQGTPGPQGAQLPEQIRTRAGRVYTREDIEATARRKNITPEQVIEVLRQRGELDGG